ncbi:hypothetical protein AAFF_G00172860 [Aldrovandia affinis]|uniref:CBM21 domain-containing protein n=1 Tax=Aldrovandia affinis TaxID=143900 RepID=A0AAD7SZ19_9TELE|nr:hypothetical protein AAFF_G00172860 [Aldrovandia affinis]
MSAAGCGADSLMEPAGEAGRVGAPGLRDDVSTDPWERALTQRGDSPSSSDESDPGSRRVSFADAFGLELVSVKEFSSGDSSTPRGPRRSGRRRRSGCGRLDEQPCELECIELLPGTASLRGIVRVLNLCYDKTVYVRTSLDGWSSHFDIQAEFVPGSSDGETDRFTFSLTLAPPFQQDGARVEFCLRYETSFGTFWANNNGMNYVLFCHQRGGRDGRGRPHEDMSHSNKKSCLKSISKSTEANQTVTSAETADMPNRKQEVVVRKPVPQSEVLQEDSCQKSSGESGRNSSRRNRRRAA